MVDIGARLLRSKRRIQWMTLAALAVVILVPSCIGFGTKLYELIVLAKSNSEGGFALVPLCNYMLATTGFGFLMIWAAFNGMFRNIEQPKFDFYDREKRLDLLFSTAMPEGEARDG